MNLTGLEIVRLGHVFRICYAAQNQPLKVSKRPLNMLGAAAAIFLALALSMQIATSTFF